MPNKVHGPKTLRHSNSMILLFSVPITFARFLTRSVEKLPPSVILILSPVFYWGWAEEALASLPYT